MRDALLRWFDRHARPLPWRERPRDGYRTLVAESMLQQTQAGRVSERYRPFLDAFPTVATLASASLEQVLGAWQGLGYYRRARALHEAARAVVREHDGRVPATTEALARLSGVGRYTAAAIAAQAFGVPGIAVDANVRRLGRRLLGAADASDTAIADGLATRLLEPSGPAASRRAEVAEALIEVGATLCRPRRPDCTSCPLAAGCRAAVGQRTRFDPVPRRRDVPVEHSRVLVVCRGALTALVRRPVGARFGGLWAFPAAGGDTATCPTLPSVGHRISHRRLVVVPVLAPAEAAPSDASWVPLAEVAAGRARLAVSGLERRIAAAALAATAGPEAP